MSEKAIDCGASSKVDLEVCLELDLGQWRGLPATTWEYSLYMVKYLEVFDVFGQELHIHVFDQEFFLYMLQIHTLLEILKNSTRCAKFFLSDLGKKYLFKIWMDKHFFIKNKHLQAEVFKAMILI